MNDELWEQPRLTLTAGGVEYLPMATWTPHPADWEWPAGWERFAGRTRDEVEAVLRAELMQTEESEGADTCGERGAPFASATDDADYDRGLYLQYGNPDAALPSWMKPDASITSLPCVIECTVRLGRYYVVDDAGAICYIFYDVDARNWAYEDAEGRRVNLK